MLLKCCYPFCIFKIWLVKLMAIENTEPVAMAGQAGVSFIFSFSPLEHRSQMEIVTNEALFFADAKRKSFCCFDKHESGANLTES